MLTKDTGFNEELASRDQTATDTERATAYRMAGHVVMHVVLDIRFSRVSIVPDEESLGRVGIELETGRKGGVHFIRWLPGGKEHQALIKWAGIIAESAVTGAQTPDPADDALPSLALLATMGRPRARDQIDFLRRTFNRAKAILNENRHLAALEALAETLLQRKALTAAEATSIIREAIQDSGKSRKKRDEA